jgi:hypothetical protein
MSFLKFTGDKMVRRLRRLMAALIIFSMANTLAGQSAGYWHNAALAIRGDGLSINNSTNHTFEFFVGSGCIPFAAAALVYLAVMFLLASVLPRKLALVFIFSVIFGHYYGASNWLATRWHLGIAGPSYLGFILAVLIVFAAFPTDEARHTVKTTRWIMLFAMLTDGMVTLIGQPAGYWHDPSLVYEGNAISKFFLLQGWYAYALEQIVIGLALYRLVAVLSSRWALVISFGFSFMGFIGSSNWFFYNWRFGWPMLVAWGCVLSIGIVFSIFNSKGKRTPVQQAGPIKIAGELCGLC